MSMRGHIAYVIDERVLCWHQDLVYEAKVLEVKQDSEIPEYYVHYKGWKNTWDSWVAQDRLLKLTEENKELAKNLKKGKETDALRQRTISKGSAAAKKRVIGSELSSAQGSEERHSSLPASGRGQKRGRDFEIEKEETFNARPSVRIPIPEQLKSFLVDDWESVTKNLTLVPLPSPHPVNEILTLYFDEEKPKRVLGSAEADLLEEMVIGMKDYFEKCLGQILLYRFERQQFYDARDSWVESKGIWAGKKNAGDVYGVEHFCRLLVAMPELIAQTNMDTQSVSRLREELVKLAQWLSRNSTRFFAKEYEAPDREYLQNAKGMGLGLGSGMQGS